MTGAERQAAYEARRRAARAAAPPPYVAQPRVEPVVPGIGGAWTPKHRAMLATALHPATLPAEVDIALRKLRAAVERDNLDPAGVGSAPGGLCRQVMDERDRAIDSLRANLALCVEREREERERSLRVHKAALREVRARMAELQAAVVAMGKMP